VDAAKVFAYSRDIGLIVDPGGMILGGTLGGEDALSYGSLGLVGTGMKVILDETPSVPLYGAGEANVARLYRDIHLKTGSGRILTIHAIGFPLGDSIQPGGSRFIMEQEIHRATPEARGIARPMGLLFDSIGAAIWSFDVDGTVLTWNRSSEAYFAHSRAGQFSPASVFLGVEDFNRIRENVNEKGSYHGNVALAARDGRAQVNKVWVTRLVSEENDPVGYACISYDPEEYGRASDLQKVLSQQPGDAVLLIDLETAQILDANYKVCDLLCCGRDDLVKKKVMDFMAEARPTLGAEILGALKAEGVMQMGRQLLKRKDGFLLPAMLTLMPATLGQQRYGLIFLVDLSIRVRIEDAVRKELGSAEKPRDGDSEGLQRSLKLQEAELGDLRKEADALRKEVAEARRRAEAAPKPDEGSRRELEEARRRLDAFRGEIENAQQREEDLTREAEEARKREEEIQRALEEASLREEDLHREIAALKARPVAPPEPPKPGIDVNRVLEETLALFETKSGPKVKVTKALKHVPPVDCLPELLKEVLLTAFLGIAEAAGKKGRINIRTRQSRRGAVIEIVDRGGGIGPSVLARLFDPVMTESKSKLTAALAPATGGKITFRAGGGKSALCRIELPAQH
jgi:PAS domain S-box-containing protein